MNYSVTDLMKAASMMSKQYFGKKDEYTISFTREADGCWYVDYPDWPFDHHNLMMVQNADALCEILSYDGMHTKIKVCVNIVSDKMPKGWFRITKGDSSITGGAHYEVDLIAANSFGGIIWLCPVTLFVLDQAHESVRSQDEIFRIEVSNIIHIFTIRILTPSNSRG